VICAISCGAVASACVSQSGGAPPHGEPGAVVPSSHGRRTTASGTEWNGASPSWAISGTFVIRWEHCNSVYRSEFAFAVMMLCVRRATALACPIPLGKSREVGVRGGVRGTIGSTKLEHELLMAEPAY
jgi:hypothetical protein